MKSVWKKLFIVVATILLVISLALVGGLWYQLDSTKSQLSLTKVQLDTTKSQLETTKAQLDTIEAQLDTTKTQLDATETQLDITKAQLDTTEAQLDTTKAQLDTTEAQLDTTEAELDTTKTQLEVAENEQVKMLNRYADLREQINIRVGKGQDAQSYITPAVQEISAEVQEITGGYSQDVNEIWRDYERLYRWVVGNIDYSVDSYTPIVPENMNWSLTWIQEFWRMPVETLKDKAGDCEDMAVLLSSMLSNYNEGEFAIWTLGIQTYDPEYKGHLAVGFPVQGNKLTILDPAGNYYTGYRSGGLRSDDVTIAVNDWLSHWAKNMPNAEIYVVFSDKFYHEFSSTNEFIEWVRQR